MDDENLIPEPQEPAELQPDLGGGEPIAPQDPKPAPQNVFDEARFFRDEVQRQREESDRLRAELASYQQRFQQAQQAPQVDPRAEQEYLSQLAPEDRISYLLEKQGRTFQGQIQQMALQHSSSEDRREFERIVDQNPELEPFIADAERIFETSLTQAAKAGNTGLALTRYQIAAFLWADKQLKEGKKALGKAKEAAAKNIARQTTVPQRPSSDAGRASKRGDSVEDSWKLLKELGIAE